MKRLLLFEPKTPTCTNSGGGICPLNVHVVKIRESFFVLLFKLFNGIKTSKLCCQLNTLACKWEKKVYLASLPPH